MMKTLLKMHKSHDRSYWTTSGSSTQGREWQIIFFLKDTVLNHSHSFTCKWQQNQLKSGGNTLNADCKFTSEWGNQALMASL